MNLENNNRSKSRAFQKMFAPGRLTLGVFFQIEACRITPGVNDLWQYHNTDGAA